MKKILIFVMAVVSFHFASAQNCKGFYPTKKGTFLETRTYDAKDKLTGINRQTIVDLNQSGDVLKIKVKTEHFDEKEKVQSSGELEMRCENGIFYMDMNSFIDPKSKEGFKDTEISVEGIDLQFPSKMQAGQSLPDGEITFKMTNSSVPMTLMAVKIYNRKVEGAENISTPAGTFDCMKISYDVELKSLMKITSKAIVWMCRDVGVVKTESYNKSGKLMSYSLLTAFKP